MVQINPFQLERYFARHEFTAPYLLSPSDCESLTLTELLELADSECRELWNSLSLGYTESPGHPLLRQEIASLYSEITPDDLIVMAPEEGIFIAMQTLLTPGDEVVVLLPAYQSLHEIARSLECRIVPWMLTQKDDGWKLDLAALEGLITSQTRLLVINFPHNPTGFQPTLAELEAIINLAKKHNLLVFSDEMYRMLEHNPEERLPSVADLYEQSIALSGMSKSFAVPGLRIGWLTTKMPGLIEGFLEYKDYTTICNSAPSEILALMALRARDKILERNMKIVMDNLRAAESYFTQRQSLFRWIPALAGSICLLKWQGPFPVEEFYTAALEKKGIMIVPGSMFGSTDEYFRVGLGRQNLPEILDQLGEILR